MQPHIRLVIWDFDNTLADTLLVWARSMERVINDYHTYFKTDPEILRQKILSAHSQHRFCDFRGLSHYLDQAGIPDKTGKTPADLYEIDAIRRNIRTTYFQTQARETRFYAGAFSTLSSIQEQNTKQVIYTDSEAAPFLRRLYLCLRHEGIAPRDGLKLFDRFYLMPSLEDDKTLLWDIDPDFLKAAKEKITLITDKNAKPNPGRVQAICADYQVSPDEALLIGDSVKDMGSALPANVNAAWYREGIQIDVSAIKILQGYASPNFIYDPCVMEQQIMSLHEAGRIVPLNGGLFDVFNHYGFVPAQYGYRHSPLSQGLHTPLAGCDLVCSPSRTPEEIWRFGPHTHAPSTP